MGVRKITAVIAVAALASTGLAACETVERETGFSQETQMGAGAGAATGGILAALLDASPAWIAAGVIVGGVAGGFLGDYLSEDDAAEHGETQYDALEALGPGQSATWNDPDAGHSGRTTIDDEFTMTDGTVCKSFTETIWVDDDTITRSGTACKTSSGRWEVEA
jgi:surface antigen